MTASMLLPAGAQARADAPLFWALLIGALLVFALVMALLALALRRKTATPRPVRSVWWIVGGGIVLPLAVLVPLHAANLQDLARAAQLPPRDALVVSVSARLWWWEMTLQDPAGGAPIAIANELVIPVGRPVRLGLSSSDVIHSLWVPALAGKVDLIPGRVQHLVLQAEAPGQWRGPCAEFCGEAHTQMALRVVGVPPQQFDAWLAQQRQPARAAETAQQQRGLEHFNAQRCSACHSVRGLTQALLADGNGGPDLTHLASREFIGAGALRNDAAGLRRWLTDPHRIKPGVRMPGYAQLDGPVLDDLVAYLGSLK